MSDPLNPVPTAAAFPEDRFRLLVDGVVDYAILGLDLNGLVTSWNAGAVRIKGYRPSEIIGQHFSVFYAPEDVAAGIPAAELVEASANGRVEIEGWRLRKDGSRFWANVVITALFDEDRRLGGFAKVTRDITKRRSVELALRESEEQFRLLVDGVVDYAIFGLDVDGRVTTWNAGAERIKGYRPSEIIGQSFSVLYSPEDVAAGIPAATLVGATTKGSVESEGWRVRKDGSQFWASVLITALFDDDRRLCGFAKLTRDITERRNAEQALRVREERGRVVEFESQLAAMVAFSNDAIWSCSRDGTITSWNGGAEHLSGYRAAEMIGRNVLRPGGDGLVAGGWIPPAMEHELPAIALRVERGERVGNSETQRICKDGSVVDLSLTVSPIRDASGTLTGMSFVGRDIGERRRHEQVLAEERRRLRAAESIGRVGSWEMDIATKAVVCSDTLLELYGVDLATFDGNFATELDRVHPDDRDEVNSAIDNCRRTGEPLKKRYRLHRTCDGVLRWFDVLGERSGEDSGSMRLVGAVLDVTDEVLAAKVLEKARDAAIEASRQKSAFLATMSHEIRTPMNGVIGMTAMLSDTTLDAEQREFTEAVTSSGEALLGIINDILDFSKIEAGGLELQLESFDLRACVEDALSSVAVTANGKGLELVGHVDEGCPPGALGDVTRLRQVLVNLLGNAVKFTARGGVALSVKPVGLSGREEVDLRFAVSDTGIGIPADRLAHLFDSFSQVDSSTTRNYGGTGLGLAISHRVVEAMGATLSVDSVSGVGSTFQFTVRFAPSAGAPDRAMLSGRCALVVDDNTTSRRILSTQLERWQMHVSEAANAEAAIAVVGSGGHFDVALIDMKIPGMNGAELAAILRSSPATAQSPIVLLVSTMDRPFPQHRDLFSAVLTKPVPADRLQTSLCDAMGPNVPPALHPGPQPARTLGGQPLRVLVAEDNPMNQLVSRLMLEKLGHFVDVAANGREAVEAVGVVSYDAVLMDIQMPEMDGLEATKLIRSELPAQQQPYIVAVSASVLVEDREACTRAGMDDYLPKPLRVGDLDSALCRAGAASGMSRSPTAISAPASASVCAP